MLTERHAASSFPEQNQGSRDWAALKLVIISSLLCSEIEGGGKSREVVTHSLLSACSSAVEATYFPSPTPEGSSAGHVHVDVVVESLKLDGKLYTTHSTLLLYCSSTRDFSHVSAEKQTNERQGCNITIAYFSST